MGHGGAAAAACANSNRPRSAHIDRRLHIPLNPNPQKGGGQRGPCRQAGAGDRGQAAAAAAVDQGRAVRAGAPAVGGGRRGGRGGAAAAEAPAREQQRAASVEGRGGRGGVKGWALVAEREEAAFPVVMPLCVSQTFYPVSGQGKPNPRDKKARVKLTTGPLNGPTNNARRDEGAHKSAHAQAPIQKAPPPKRLRLSTQSGAGCKHPASIGLLHEAAPSRRLEKPTPRRPRAEQSSPPRVAAACQPRARRGEGPRGEGSRAQQRRVERW
jgi:hypothetical protein